MEQPTRLTGAEERKTGQSYLGHNTMNNQGQTSPEYSMEVSQWSSPEREALRSIRLTAAPTQKGVPVPTSCINQPEGRSMRISSDRFHWGKHQSLHIAEQWTSGFANVARILPSARQEETAGSTTRAEGSSALKLYTSPHSPRQVGAPWKLPITSVRAPHGGQPLGTYK